MTKNKGKMSKSDFAKLPKAEQEKILKQREENRKKLLAEAKAIDIDSVVETVTASTLGEREYGKKFRLLYNVLRKSLVALDKQRKAKIVTNEQAYLKALEILENQADSN